MSCSFFQQKKQYFDSSGKLQHLISCIYIHTAHLLFDTNRELFLKNARTLCMYNNNNGSVNNFLPKFNDSNDSLVILNNLQKIVFRYDAYTCNPAIALQRSNQRFHRLCWLPPNKSPVDDLNRDVWAIIAKHLSIEDKCNMRLVSRKYNSIFSSNIMWYYDLESIRNKIPLEYHNIYYSLSYQQQVLRFLWYVRDEKQFVKVFGYGGLGAKLFAEMLGFRLYPQFDKKRKRNTVVVTKNPQTHFMSKAKLAVGRYDYNRQQVISLFWITTRGNLRYRSNHKRSELTWDCVLDSIHEYRNKIK